MHHVRVDNVEDRLVLECGVHHHAREFQVLLEHGTRRRDVERRRDVQVLLIEGKPLELVLLRKDSLESQLQ